MAFTVRVFGHAGLVRMPVIKNAAQFSSDSVFQLQQPYLWRQALTTNGTTPVSTTAAVISPDITTVLRIEVPDGQAIRYEVNAPARPGGSVNADVNSPILAGLNQIAWGAGFTLSVIDASGT